MQGKKGNRPEQFDAKPALYTIALIAAALGLIVVSSLLLPGIGRAFRGPESLEHAPPPGDVSMFENNFALSLFFSLLNVGLAIYILFIYVKDYLAVRSSFTLGMVVFVFSFLLYAISSLPLVHMVLGPYGAASRLSVVPMVFSAICLAIFAKLSSE
jgi:hypothetical protein